MMKQPLILILLAASVTAEAQNPIIRDQFTADPTARVFNNKVYLYPSHDITPPEGQRQDWFCMADYHVFSSENLTDWTDHGLIVSQTNVPWGNPDGYSMWAPDCVCKNGKYYFYFPNAPREGRGFAIGVATADRPEGPFTLEPEPIPGVTGIDPCVLVDNDGSAYIYWSGMGIRGAKLKDNMKQLDGELKQIQMAPPGAQNPQGMQRQPARMLVGGETMEGLPEGFKEGPFAFRRGDWYYLTFPWVRGSKENGANPTETLAYAMSKNPLGPWDFKGIIMAEHSNGCWTNHHSILEYKGQWYIFYHTNFFSPKDDKRRSACIEKLTFNADGTIQEVKETMRGVGVNQATEKINVDRFSSSSASVANEAVDTANYMRGGCVKLSQKGSWSLYKDVDFGCITDGYIIVSAKATDDVEFCVRENNAKGKVIARFKMAVRPPEPSAGAANSPMGRFNRDLRNQWLTQTATLEYTPKGIADLVITNEGGGAVSVDWVQFKNRPKYFSPVTTPSAQPDEDGFIRRWLLLEPIDKPNRGNTVFTDSYLHEHFGMEYFKGQQTILPKDGQKVKTSTNQTLTWHALDSENFNVKLFRFAEKWGQKVYGVLFWVVTYIDCEEDIENVRLAVGSNSASMWWLQSANDIQGKNDEETLLLSGDRRMVKDDCMSHRLTLKKGRNILRGAIINGPGMSDFCVRFLNEKGEPVTNYKVRVKSEK